MPATVFDKPIFPGAKIVVADLTVTNTSGAYSNVVTDSRISASMKAYALEITDPSIFGDKISVTAGNGQYTFACNNVAGTTTVKISFLKVLDDPTAITSTEFDTLSNEIGTLTNLHTTAKTNVVAAVNENTDTLSAKANRRSGGLTTVNNTSLSGSYVQNATTCSGLPGNTGYYIAALFDFLQLAVRYDGGQVGDVYIRFNANDVWSNWRGLATLISTSKTVTFVANTTANDNMSVYKSGNIVCINGRMKSTANVAGNGGLLFTLPSDCCPPASVRFAVRTTGNRTDTTFGIEVASDGKVKTNQTSATISGEVYYYFSAAFCV